MRHQTLKKYHHPCPFSRANVQSVGHPAHHMSKKKARTKDFINRSTSAVWSMMAGCRHLRTPCQALQSCSSYLSPHLNTHKLFYAYRERKSIPESGASRNGLNNVAPDLCARLVRQGRLRAMLAQPPKLPIGRDGDSECSQKHKYPQRYLQWGGGCMGKRSTLLCTTDAATAAAEVQGCRISSAPGRKRYMYLSKIRSAQLVRLKREVDALEK